MFLYLTSSVSLNPECSKDKNSAKCGVSPVSFLSQNRAKHKKSTKVYAAANKDDTRKRSSYVSLLQVAGEKQTGGGQVCCSHQVRYAYLLTRERRRPPTKQETDKVN